MSKKTNEGSTIAPVSVSCAANKTVTIPELQTREVITPSQLTKEGEHRAVLLKIKAYSESQNIRSRKTAITIVLSAYVITATSSMALLYLQGFQALGFSLPLEVSRWVIPSVVTETLVMTGWVLKYLLK